MSERIDAPAKLIERLRPVQEQINRLQAEIQAALFGAQVALDVPDGWRWDGAGWIAPEAPGVGDLLSPPAKLPGTAIPDPVNGVYLHPPFAGRHPIGQLWGENSSFYARFTYDGVPLLGHNGVDFSTPEGTPLFAVDDGVVRQVGFDPEGFGNYILLAHAWGESLYAHLAAVDVAPEQPVVRGQGIGRSGNTGGSSGPHLHFAIRINPYQRNDGWGGFSDPLPTLPLGAYVLPDYILDPAPAQAPMVAAAAAPMSTSRLAPSAMGDDMARP